jgi:hypothetical protein
MTWKRVEQEGRFSHYERRCRHCDGKGKEILDHRGSYATCSHCPNDRMDVLEHPANSCFDPERKDSSVQYNVQRCNACGLFWLVYSEGHSWDSVDYPAPECLGPYLPADDWRPKGTT